MTEATKVWAWIGLNSFGGPAGQIAVMHRVLVEERRWIGPDRFLHALNYCMLLPGPEAQQLTVYVGWLLHGYAGGLIAGTLFVLPGALVMLGLSWGYAAFAAAPPVAGALAGVKGAVIAVVLEALSRVGRRALKGRAHCAVAALSFAAISLGAPFAAIVAAAGLTGALLGLWRPGLLTPAAPPAPPANAPPVPAALLDREIPPHTLPSLPRAALILALGLALWLGPVAALQAALGPDHVHVQLGWFFSRTAVITFGGAYAVLAHVGQQAVEGYGWLSRAEMMDGLGLAETTPGPLILVLQHVAFLAAWRDPGALAPWQSGILGAAVCLWSTFAPCFLWIFLGAPWIERLRQSRPLAAALACVTAAVVGVILDLSLRFASHALFAGSLAWDGPLGITFAVPDPASLRPGVALIAAAACLALLRWHAGMIPVLLLSALAGWLGWWIGWI